MTRAQLIERLLAQHPQLSELDADRVVRILLGEMKRALIKDHRIEIRGFGSFALRARAPRKARNPRSGASVMVEAKAVPHFKPGRDLRLALQGQAGDPIRLAVDTSLD